MPFKLVDSRGNYLRYLRVSITDRCNLKCLYCSPVGYLPKLKYNDILRYEEITRLIEIGTSLGIEKIRVTGGEPLVRKGVYKFIERLSCIKKIKDISLTTNGTLLLKNAEKLKKAGIKRINVSLDTLDITKYKHITNHNKFKVVWDGIMRAYELGFSPIKINVVVIKGINENEIHDFASLSSDYPFHIRFIEYMPIGLSQIKSKHRILISEIKNKIHNVRYLTPIDSGYNDGPAKRFRFNGALGEVGFISALSHASCNKCNRLRLTANGELRACLLSNHSISLKDLIRNGFSDEEIAKALIKLAQYKNGRHHLNSLESVNDIVGQMYNIGG